MFRVTRYLAIDVKGDHGHLSCCGLPLAGECHVMTAVCFVSPGLVSGRDGRCGHAYMNLPSPNVQSEVRTISLTSITISRGVFVRGAEPEPHPPEFDILSGAEPPKYFTCGRSLSHIWNISPDPERCKISPAVRVWGRRWSHRSYPFYRSRSRSRSRSRWVISLEAGAGMLSGAGV